jgi:hypothetical protein
MTDEELISTLRSRTKKVLSKNWLAGRECPECGSEADRPKCMWDFGPNCPRLDPDNYSPPAWEYVPDKDCATAADRIEALTTEVAAYGRSLELKQALIEDLKAEIEQLRERLAALDQQAEALGGCGDANCVIHRPKGQHTNGGCHCYENRAKMRIWTQQVSYFRSKVRAALEKKP